MAAPSSSSFPPSFSSFPDIEPEAGPSKSHGHTKEGERGKDKGRGERRKEKNKREEIRRESKTDAGSFLRDVQVRKKDEVLEEVSAGRPFFVDTNGDPLNITYGGLHAGDVPKHNLVGRGRKILGLSNEWSVTHRGRSRLETAIGGKRKFPSIHDVSARRLLKAPPTRTLVNTGEDRYQHREIDGFLRLPGHLPRPPAESYREITSKNHDHLDDSQSSSEDEEASSSDDASNTAHVSSLQSTLKSLEEQLKDDPSSIPTWLNLLFHTLSTIPSDAKNAAKMKLEITLSVLERAMDADSSNKKSKTLWLRYLRAGEELWTETKLNDKWEEALRINDTDLWIEWLDWRIRKTRNMESVVSDVERVLFSLRLASDEIGGVRAFWRIAIAFRDAGFTERATALFQAQAELTYKKPPRISDSPFSSQLESLGAFWESEVARIGEDGAQGWGKWDESGRPERSDVPTGIQGPPAVALSDPYSRWAMDELAVDRTQLLPKRSDSEEDSDPYATILFSDIQPFLLDLKTNRAREIFRRVWVSMLGLHIPGFAASMCQDPSNYRDDRWCCTAFSSPHHLASIFPRDTSVKLLLPDAQAGILVGKEREYNSPFGPVKEWGLGVLGPLDRISNPPWGMWTGEDVMGVDQALVREVFVQCRLPGLDTEWTVLHLAFEAAVSLKSSVKVSKSLLAAAQKSLFHWAAHARLEQLRGRLDDARKVYQTVLASADLQSPGYCTLWWDWAEMEWLSGASDAALKVIFQCARSSGTGGVAILRAKRYLEDVWDTLSSDPWKEHEAWLKLRALHELLTASPVAALSVFDTYLRGLETRTVPHESVSIASLYMLYVHGPLLRNPLPPALLRERIEQAVEMYPSNTILLGLFLEAEKGQSVWGRVRLLLGEHPLSDLLRPKDVARRVAEVWAAGWEKGKWKAEEERTRNGLSAAVQDDRSRYSSILWRIYLEFEIRAGELKRAKKLLFRAVGECPLVKELYLLAFGPLRSVFSPRELNELADTMAERGIRTRQGLDEALDGWTDHTAQQHITHDEDENENVEDDIEYNARELRRLRPY